jgi:hypothetical protein
MMNATNAVLLPERSDEAPVLKRVYDLRGNNGNSDHCFADVAILSDAFLAETEARAGELLEAHLAFLQLRQKEPARSRGEYAFDLLLVGHALRQYGDTAEAASDWSMALARALFWIRRRSTPLKPLADGMRAILVHHLLMPQKGRKPTSQCSGIARLGRTIQWLLASGEFEQLALRCRYWLRFLQTLSLDEAVRWVGVCCDLAAWFEREADVALGAYTRGVSDFLAADFVRRGCREDQLFCGQQPVDYHLGMVAAELMNRGLRIAFERTGRKVVLLPACMRAARADRCRAQGEKPDLICAGCDPECNVNSITRQFLKRGATVYLVPHSSSFSRWLERWKRETDTGVIVVACLLNILPGGLEVRAKGIVAQCVPLDFPGCRKHWNSEGISTRVNQERIVQIAASSLSP